MSYYMTTLNYIGSHMCSTKNFKCYYAETNPHKQADIGTLMAKILYSASNYFN